MPQWLLITSTIMQFAPTVLGYLGQLLGLIGQAEETSLPGPDKRDAVVNGVVGTFEAAKAFAAPNTVIGRLDTEQVKAAVGGLNDLVVGILNAAGVFGHKQTPSAAPSFGGGGSGGIGVDAR